MSTLWSVPACGLATFICLRLLGVRWNIAAGVALLGFAFAPLPATGAGLGVLLAARRRGRELAPRDWMARAWLGRRPALVSADGLAIGCDARRALVRIPLRSRSGAHTLIVGATGSGKTVTEAWIVARAIDHGHGAVIVDPKGDALLRSQAAGAALRAGRQFIEWTPDGPAVYNPYAHGSASEIADKAIAGEPYSEPHYQRQAQRYLAHAVRALHGAGETVTPRRLLELMDPRELELAARASADEGHARALFGYLDSLDARQRSGLAGTRDRLAILAESELGRWLDPRRGNGPPLDLLAAIRARAVVYFRLEADRLPLLARMLAAAIVADLLTVAASAQRSPVPTLVAIDEFSAISAAGVARLFGRARAAGFSLLLATQELADLRSASDELLDQVLGNVECVIAHRQSAPDSAELVARIAGTQEVWAKTEQLSHSLATGRATRTLGREYVIHPDRVKALRPGTAAVNVVSAGRCTVARIFHPYEMEAGR
ncbi:MAG: type IV secretion system DNA-binding domain-containing protein [Solirubrobacteraceae bacterium]|jgi:type IV secretory pathway TraG/TraD family ATPase VirD4